MTKTIKCTAKNRETCRYHGPLDHATIDLQQAQEAYDAALAKKEAAGENSDKTLDNTVRNRKNKLRLATAEYESFPGPRSALRRNLRAAKAELNVEQVTALEKRLKASDTVIKRKKDAEKAEAARLVKVEESKTAFRKWKEANAERYSKMPAWKTALRKQTAASLIAHGNFDSTEKDYKTGRVNWQGGNELPAYRKAHVQACGVSVAGPIREEIEAGIEHGYYDDSYGVVDKNISCEISCNCGEVFQAKAHFNGSMFDLLSREGDTYEETGEWGL